MNQPPNGTEGIREESISQILREVDIGVLVCFEYGYLLDEKVEKQTQCLPLGARQIPSPFRNPGDESSALTIHPDYRHWSDPLRPSHIPNNVIGFVMAIEGCSYEEAVGKLIEYLSGDCSAYSSENSPNKKNSQELSKKFDGHMVVDLRHNDLLLDKQDIHLFTYGDTVKLKLKIIAMALLYDENKNQSDVSEDKNSFNEEQMAWLMKHYQYVYLQFGKEIADLIMEGRLKVSLLIGTNGGERSIYNNLRILTENITERGGEVEAYVYGTAASVGANVFTLASKRYITLDASFMWHPGIKAKIDDDGNYYDINSLQWEKVRIVRNFFSTYAHPDKLMNAYSDLEKRIVDAQQDPENHTDDVWFSALELHQYGLVTQIFPNAAGILQKYEESCPTER